MRTETLETLRQEHPDVKFCVWDEDYGMSNDHNMEVHTVRGWDQYLIALHELGHIRSACDPNTNQDDYTRDRIAHNILGITTSYCLWNEAKAWEWALDYLGREPTPRECDRIILALSSYTSEWQECRSTLREVVRSPDPTLIWSVLSRVHYAKEVAA